MLEANRLVLEDIEPHVDGELDRLQSSRAGSWSSKGAVLERTTVRGPAVIGAGARIVDAYIGPYTAIGEDCEVIGLGGRALDPARAAPRSATSAPGWRPACWAATSTLSRSDGLPKTIRMIVGDNSELTLP